MKAVNVFIIFVSITFFACKKKDTPPITIFVDQTNAEDFIYGHFNANITTIKTQTINPFFQPTNYYISYQATFFASPENDQEVLPEILSISINGQPLIKSQNPNSYLDFDLFNIQSIPNPDLRNFKHLNFTFTSLQLGGFNQISENDTVLPTYTLSFTDTLYLDRNVVNTFTVNNTTANYGCSVGNLFSNNSVPQGTKVVKIYPSQIKNLSVGTIDNINVSFYKQKKINSLGRNYLLNVYISDSYPIKIIG